VVALGDGVVVGVDVGNGVAVAVRVMTPVVVGEGDFDGVPLGVLVRVKGGVNVRVAV